MSDRVPTNSLSACLTAPTPVSVAGRVFTLTIRLDKDGPTTTNVVFPSINKGVAGKWTDDVEELGE